MTKAILLSIALVILSLFLAGCQQGTTVDNTVPYIGGKEGVTMSFSEGMPPDQVFDNGQLPFGIQVRLDNVGESDIQPNDLYIEITGVNPTAFGMASQADFKKNLDIVMKGSKKNFDGTPLKGDTAWIAFDNLRYVPDLHGNLAYMIRANACYKYTTMSSTKICVNRDVIKNINKNKICDLSGAKTVHNSGGPVAVTNFKQDPIGGGKIQISFDVSHVGPGDGIFKDTLVSCDESVMNPDKNKVYIDVSSNIQNGAVKPSCSGLETPTDGNSKGYVRLHDGMTTRVVCVMDLNPVGDAVFEDLVNINLVYKYLQHLDQPMLVQDVSTAASN